MDNDPYRDCEELTDNLRIFYVEGTDHIVMCNESLEDSVTLSRQNAEKMCAMFQTCIDSKYTHDIKFLLRNYSLMPKPHLCDHILQLDIENTKNIIFTGHKTVHHIHSIAKFHVGDKLLLSCKCDNRINDVIYIIVTLTLVTNTSADYYNIGWDDDISIEHLRRNSPNEQS